MDHIARSLVEQRSTTTLAVAVGGDQVHGESLVLQPNRHLASVGTQVVIGQIFEEAPVDILHLHAGDGAERDQNVHMRGQGDRGVLDVGA